MTVLRSLALLAPLWFATPASAHAPLTEASLASGMNTLAQARYTLPAGSSLLQASVADPQRGSAELAVESGIHLSVVGISGVVGGAIIAGVGVGLVVVGAVVAVFCALGGDDCTELMLVGVGVFGVGAAVAVVSAGIATIGLTKAGFALSKLGVPVNHLGIAVAGAGVAGMVAGGVGVAATDGEFFGSVVGTGFTLFVTGLIVETVSVSRAYHGYEGQKNGVGFVPQWNGRSGGLAVVGRF